MADPVKRASWLCEEIEKHNRLYYQEAKPEISDKEYDKLLKELVDLEKKHPELANAMATKITETLKAGHPDVRIDGVDSVSGKVSEELFSTGMRALLAAMASVGLSVDVGGYVIDLRAVPVAVAALPRALRWMLPRAHQAIRQREYTKSLLVDVTNRLKRGYRHLGGLLAREGRLPDADLVFFFTHDELTRFCAAPARAGADHALARRRALAYQDRLHFADVMVGPPRPLPAAPPTAAADTLAGRPVSGGVVEGLARVCHTVDEAAALKPGEILVAPITDVGWTPYFSLIAGLAKVRAYGAAETPRAARVKAAKRRLLKTSNDIVWYTGVNER